MLTQGGIRLAAVVAAVLLHHAVKCIPLSDDKLKEFEREHFKLGSSSSEEDVYCQKSILDSKIQVDMGPKSEVKCYTKCMILNLMAFDDEWMFDLSESEETQWGLLLQSFIRSCNVTAMMMEDNCELEMEKYNCYYYSTESVEEVIETSELERCETKHVENEIFVSEFNPRKKPEYELKCYRLCDITSPQLPKRMINDEKIDVLQNIKKSKVDRFKSNLDKCNDDDLNFNICNQRLFHCYGKAISVLFK